MDGGGDIWYRQGLRFACRQCGNCCTGAPGCVFLTEQEAHNIAAYLGREGKGLTKEHLRRVGVRNSLTEDPRSGDCCFLQRRNGQMLCRVYPVRPLQCRTWPFWEANLRSPEHWDAAAADCPGMNRGPAHDEAHIQTCRGAKRWEDLPDA
jgi:hypothetical protein